MGFTGSRGMDNLANLWHVVKIIRFLKVRFYGVEFSAAKTPKMEMYSHNV